MNLFVAITILLVLHLTPIRPEAFFFLHTMLLRNFARLGTYYACSVFSHIIFTLLLFCECYHFWSSALRLCVAGYCVLLFLVCDLTRVS